MHRGAWRLGICLILLNACMPDAKKTRALPAWAAEMQAESQLLDLTQPRVWVENEVLGVQEGLDTNVVAWESVYAFFLDAAVQEEAMQTGYAFEKTVGLSDSVLEWTAEKRNRRPQLLRLIYSRTKGELLAVQIENETDNMFYKSAQSLRYAKGDSILIVGMNQLRWQERKSYRQMIRF